MINLILISISLAMDCLAVSIASGATITKPKITSALKVGLSFGFFQAIMPLIGWVVGFSFRSLIENVDHWIAFSLLLIIGIKMLYEAFKKSPQNNKTDITRIPTLLLLSIATSIDALVLGISLSILDISIYLSILIIGLFAFTFSVSGYYLGHRIGKIIGNKVEIIGGIILIGIGIKILIEHMI
ncbi:MAG: manganese efflux pump MntP family protein [Actinobacteria bacterium]|nr:manganese efflux pump MntP family protein [Actinomycetota bacterium]